MKISKKLLGMCCAFWVLTNHANAAACDLRRCYAISGPDSYTGIIQNAFSGFTLSNLTTGESIVSGLGNQTVHGPISFKAIPGQTIRLTYFYYTLCGGLCGIPGWHFWDICGASPTRAALIIPAMATPPSGCEGTPSPAGHPACFLAGSTHLCTYPGFEPCWFNTSNIAIYKDIVLPDNGCDCAQSMDGVGALINQ
jgi:hypothetical protein